jgi:hypothetical protein
MSTIIVVAVIFALGVGLVAFALTDGGSSSDGPRYGIFGGPSLEDQRACEGAKLQVLPGRTLTGQDQSLLCTMLVDTWVKGGASCMWEHGPLFRFPGQEERLEDMFPGYDLFAICLRFDKMMREARDVSWEQLRWPERLR